jgi:hypothetical protein
MTSKNLSKELDDSRAANWSILYLLAVLAFVGWLLFDIWIDAHTLARLLGYDVAKLQTSLFHVEAYTVIGGAIGGIINGLRSALLYYGSFNRRYIWKYITAPWMGSALAIIGFALLRSTVAIFGGSAPAAAANTQEFLANFGIGALAGYGAKDVFIWLDSQVSKLFAVKKDTPDVMGQTAAAAVEQIQAQDLAVDTVATTPVESAEEDGRVLSQTPKPGEPIESGQAVALEVGSKSNGKEPTVRKKVEKK